METKGPTAYQELERLERHLRRTGARLRAGDLHALAIDVELFQAVVNGWLVEHQSLLKVTSAPPYRRSRRRA